MILFLTGCLGKRLPTRRAAVGGVWGSRHGEKDPTAPRLPRVPKSRRPVKKRNHFLREFGRKPAGNTAVEFSKTKIKSKTRSRYVFGPEQAPSENGKKRSAVGEGTLEVGRGQH